MGHPGERQAAPRACRLVRPAGFGIADETALEPPELRAISLRPLPVEPPVETPRA